MGTLLSPVMSESFGMMTAIQREAREDFLLSQMAESTRAVELKGLALQPLQSTDTTVSTGDISGLKGDPTWNSVSSTRN